MSLLDELKRQVEAAKQAQVQCPRHADARADEIRAVALPALFRINHCLQDLVAQLKILQQEAPATLKIPGAGPVTGFMQGGYEVFAEGNPPETVTLRCALRYPKGAPLEVKAVGTLNGWLEAARRQGLQAKVLRALESNGPNQRAYVALEGAVPATLQFKLDLEAAALQLFSRNFEELSERRQIFNPAQVTESWCEELIKYVLRQEHRFMMQEIAPDVREQLRRRLEWEKQKEIPADMLEALAQTSNRLKGLFKRSPQLRLRFADQTWDLANHLGPFTLGRVGDCDLTVREQRVSRFHARIERRDDSYILTDESTNGTSLRHADGHVELLKGSSAVLSGAGLIALGTQAVETNPNVIRYSH